MTSVSGILTGAQQDSVLAAAQIYAASGHSVVPLRGKAPSINWTPLQSYVPGTQQVTYWHTRGWLQNVGIVCGAVSRNLVVIDLDGLHNAATYEKAFPDWLNTFTVLTGSGNGKHYYYYVDQLPATTRAKGFELRSSGTYVAAVPSLHPTSLALYQVANAQPVMRVRSMEAIRVWIAGMHVFHDQRRKPGNQPGGGIQRATNYAAAALRSEAEKVRAAGDGERNNVLFRAALRLGNLIDMQMISEYEVTDALARAAGALTVDDGEAATLRTIASGIKIGRTANRRTS